MKELPFHIIQFIDTLEMFQGWFVNCGRAPLSNPRISGWKDAIVLADKDDFVNTITEMANDMRLKLRKHLKNNSTEANRVSEDIQQRLVPIAFYASSLLSFNKSHTKRQRRTAGLQILGNLTNITIAKLLKIRSSRYFEIQEAYTNGYFPCSYDSRECKFVLY